MRNALVILAAIGASVLARPAAGDVAQSNPAFLGISWSPTGNGPCEIGSVVPNGPAEAAKLRAGDYVLAFDGTMITSCATLTSMIVSHDPGDEIMLDVMRGGQHVALAATLSTRASVVNLSLLGKLIDAVGHDYEDNHEVDLRDVGNQTTILAWADLMHCDGCASLIRRVVDVNQHTNHGDNRPRIITVTRGDLPSLQSLHIYLGAPLVVGATTENGAGPDDFFQKAALDEQNRVYFTVLTRRGVVRFVTPIAPDDDAVDAAIDDVLAAAEQADRVRS